MDSLRSFGELARMSGEAVDLGLGALLIAQIEHPDLEVGHELKRLDELAARAGRGDVHRLRRFLFEDEGFAGNASDYYDPKNSWLNDVLDRKVGIPITLAVVLLEIFARAGVEAAGVSFPGHFLVRSPGPSGPLFIDPFDGRILDREGLRELHGRVAGEPSDPDPRMLEPTGKKQVLVRMLHNLRGIFAAGGDRARLRAVLERLEILTPSDDLRREIVSLGGESPVPPTKSRILN